VNLLLLGHASSSHTYKWARSVADGVNRIRVLSLVAPRPGLFEALPNVSVEVLEQEVRKGVSPLSKIKYLRVLSEIRERIRSFRPDILHAHYASSYGLLGALSGFRPYVVSVWGSDVYDFPRRSPLHRLALRYSLSRADRILSTSDAMARETRKYSGKPIEVTPFGIDLERFRPDCPRRDVFPGELVIGTTKALEDVYGQEYLIRAFAGVLRGSPGLPLRLWLIGRGQAETRLRALAAELGVENRVTFEGLVPNESIQECHARIDIFAMLSNAESFGVAALEAQACGKPVVATAVGGLPEVVEDGVTGFLVPPRDPGAAAAAIGRLSADPELRSRMGRAGRARVEALYDWNRCVRQREELYASLLAAGVNGSASGGG
jgi:glycosyltransferase involved in cell wall biosynthesis